MQVYGCSNNSNGSASGAAERMTAADLSKAESTAATRVALKGIFLYANRFADSTSMHGVSQLFQVDSYARRAFWLALSCLTTTAGCYHVYLTVTQFILTPVNTLILNQGVDTVFPDVTFCNLKPMPQYLLHYNTRPRMEAESSMLALLQDLKLVYSRMYAKRPEQLRNLFSTHDYFNWYQFLQHYWSSQPTAWLGYNLSLGLVGCFYKKARCRASDFELLQSPHYWNCWSFRPKDRTVQGTGPADGLQVILYTSTIPKSEISETGDYIVTYPPARKRSILEQLGTVFGKAGAQTSSGIRVLLHEPDTYPHLYWDGVDVGNGWSSDLRFQMTRNVYVNRTDNRCVEKYGRVSYWVAEPDLHREFRRRTQDCVVQRWQETLQSQCGCESTFLPNSKRRNLCHHVDPGTNRTSAYAQSKVKQLQKYIAVERAVRQRMSNKFVADCARVQECERNSYSYAASAAPWPAYSDLEAFVHTFVMGPAGNLMGKRFHDIPLLDLILDYQQQTPLNNLSSRSTAESSARSWNTSLRFVRENFVKLHVYAEESKGTLVRESPSYSFVEVLSELGGIGGLWAGMSLVTCVELLEFLLLFCVKCVQALCNYYRFRSHFAAATNGGVVGGKNRQRIGSGKTGANDDDELMRILFPCATETPARSGSQDAQSMEADGTKAATSAKLESCDKEVKKATSGCSSCDPLASVLLVSAV